VIVQFEPATQTTETVADLVDRLGGIPLKRIRTKPPLGTATVADLEKSGKPICELIDGTLVEKAMGNAESMWGGHIFGLIWAYVTPRDLGVVLGEAGRLWVGDDQLRAPDVTFIPWASFPNEELPKEAYWKVPAGLIVEVLSPGNTPGEIDRKLREFFAAKCKLAWVIDPATKTARVYTSATKFKTLDGTGMLDGGKVLPGFQLPLAELFAVGQRRPGKKR
jgi:Uma2 family endonuclease